MKAIDVRDRFSPDYVLGLLTGKYGKSRIDEPDCNECSGDRIVYDSTTRSVSDCPSCREALDKWRFERNAERSKGVIVSYSLIESLGRQNIVRPEIVELAKLGPQPIFIVGPTRTGKSLLMRYFYNRLIREQRGIAAGAIFITETELLRIFGEIESYEAFMSFCFRARDKHEDYFVIIPDAFRAKQFKNRDSGRHHDSRVWDNYFEWLDRFVLDRDVKLCIAANVGAKAVLDVGDPREKAIEERFLEQAGGKITWLE